MMENGLQYEGPIRTAFVRPVYDYEKVRKTFYTSALFCNMLHCYTSRSIKRHVVLVFDSSFKIYIKWDPIRQCLRWPISHIPPKSSCSNCTAGTTILMGEVTTKQHSSAWKKPSSKLPTQRWQLMQLVILNPLFFGFIHSLATHGIATRLVPR